MSVINNLNNKEKTNKSQSVKSPLSISSVPITNKLNKSKEIKFLSKILTDRNKIKKRNLKIIKKLEPKNIDEKEILRVVNRFLNHYKTPFDLCVNVLIQFPNYRNKEIIDLILPYLKDLIGLMDLISKEKNEELADKTLYQIAMNLQYKKVEKNKYICKFGEKGNHFYIILKGKVVFLVPKIIKCYLNENEYINYLLKLKKCGENELLKNILNINRQYYDFGDDFDSYIKDLVHDYKNNKKNNQAFMTPQLYHVLKQSIEEEKKKLNNNVDNKDKDNEIIDIEEYIERSKVDDMDLTSKNRKKINVYEYQITNYYEEGQIFGMVALESKNGKRTATAISLENCEFGILTKDQYISYLLAMHNKSLELLFELINSYSILGFAPKKAFDNRFCHMFKCIRFKRGAQILEENQKMNSVIVFNSGQFSLTINKSILEINDLIIKLQKIRGKMMGLSENEIKKECSENDFSKDYFINQKFILPETMKMYQKKHNLTISIVNDKLVVGLLDTVDPDTHLSLFNCICISQVCVGYEIKNKSLDLVDKEYSCKTNINKIFLINVEYFLKRLQLHLKELESKIEKFNKNLKFEIQPIKKIKSLSTEKRNDEEDKMIIIENNKDENDDDDYEIRRNSFYLKKKNSNELNLVQILGKSLKNDYSTLKKSTKFNTIERNNDSLSNLNSDSKKYESLKTINDETIEIRREKNLSYFSKIKKRIENKERLLQLARDKSNKYIQEKKAEMRSLNIARRARVRKDQYYDLSKFFNRSLSSSKENQRKDNKKFYPYKIENTESENKDRILNKIINKINKNSKYERILSSYISNKKRMDVNENEDNEKKDIKNEEKLEENKSSEKYNILKSETKANISDIKKNSIRYFETDVNRQGLRPNNKSTNTMNYINNDKNIKYPFIRPNLKNLLYDNYKNYPNIMLENKNIITLDGPNTIINRDNYKSISNKKKFKKYNKIMANNYRISRKLFDLNKANKISDKSTGVQFNINEKADINNNKLPNILSVYNRDKVHFVDPLVLDKFNDQYFNKKLKTLDN